MSFVGSVAHFVHGQFSHLPYPTTRWDGKTIIITGGNGGLGLETAKHVYRLGASRLIITARSASKGAEAKALLEREISGSGTIEVWPLDLDSFDSVQDFAQRLETLERIDAVLENAGYMDTTAFTMSQGFEKHVTVNVISTFLLAFLVLPILRVHAERHGIRPHLVIVSSDVHNWAAFKERKCPQNRPLLEALNDEKIYGKSDRYMVSKLLEVWVCRAMVERMRPDDPIVLNFVNPGFCYSNLGNNGAGEAVPQRIARKVIARPGEVGSRNFVYAVSAGPESHGQYISNCQVEKVGGLAASKEGPELQKRVFSEVCGALERIAPGVTRNL